MGEGGVSRGVLWILVRRLFKVANGARQLFRRSPVPEVSSFEIVFVCFRAHPRFLSQALLFLRSQVDADLLHNCGRDTILQCQYVAHLAFISIGPPMSIGGTLY